MREATVDVLMATSSRYRPSNVALAIGLGIMVGASVTSPVLMLCYLVAAVVLPTHFLVFALVGSASAAVFLTFEAWFGNIGYWALMQPALASTVGWIHSLPLGAWLRLNNTVVYGSVLVGGILSASLSTVAWIALRDMMPERTWKTKQKSVFEELPSVEIPDFVLLPESEIMDRVTEESFVELSEADMALLAKLDGKRQAAPEDEEIAPAIAAALQEAESAAEPAKVASSQPLEPSVPERDSSEEQIATSKDSADREHVETEQTPDQTLTHFDAAARLEELLSGCRVQPHWVDAHANSSQDESEADSSEYDEATSSESAGTEEVLERSAEMLGLVDELMGQIEAEDKAEQPTEEQPPSIAAPPQARSDEERSEDSTLNDSVVTNYVDPPAQPALRSPALNRVQSTEGEEDEAQPSHNVAGQKTASKQIVQPGHNEALRYLLRHLKSSESAESQK